MAELHKDLETYYETLDTIEDKAERSKIKARTYIEEEVEVIVFDLIKDVEHEHPTLNRSEIRDLLAEVLGEYV